MKFVLLLLATTGCVTAGGQSNEGMFASMWSGAFPCTSPEASHPGLLALHRQSWLALGSELRYGMSESLVTTGSLVWSLEGQRLGLSAVGYGDRTFRHQRFCLAWSQQVLEGFWLGPTIGLDRLTAMHYGKSRTWIVGGGVMYNDGPVRIHCRLEHALRPFRKERIHDSAPPKWLAGAIYRFSGSLALEVSLRKSMSFPMSWSSGIQCTLHRGFTLQLGLTARPEVMRIAMIMSIGGIEVMLAGTAHQALGSTPQIRIGHAFSD